MGLRNSRVGFGPGTHNAPIFPAGEVSLPRLEKENFCDWLGVGNSGLVMLVYSNVHITGEFSIFGVTFHVAIWLLVFQRVNMVSRRTLSMLYFSDCFMEEAYEEGL